ncbi:MAG TPA: hypothetical protein VGF20_03745 [Candidatus Acidoferrum sp.]|jgi:hypothetical protein
MIAVSDTTPLRYLLAIKQVRLFENIFEKVLVPDAVFEELTNPMTPEIVRRTVSQLPGWLAVQTISPTVVRPTSDRLGKGERQAIILAESLRPDFLLMDEKIGRLVALE